MKQITPEALALGRRVRRAGTSLANVDVMDESIGAPQWTYALDDTALGEGRMAAAYPLGVNVLLTRVGGAVYAVTGKCAHMACPLSAGRLEGYTVVCGCHDWRFDVRTGRFLDAPELGLRVYPTKLEAGRLFVNVSREETA